MNDEQIDHEDNQKSRLVRLPEVRRRVGLGASTIYRYLAAGKFPRPVEIGGGRVAWYESDIDAWIASRRTSDTREPEYLPGELPISRSGGLARSVVRHRL